MIGLPDGSKSFMIDLATCTTHITGMLNVLSGIVTGVACIKSNEQIGHVNVYLRA